MKSFLFSEACCSQLYSDCEREKLLVKEIFPSTARLVQGTDPEMWTK